MECVSQREEMNGDADLEPKVNVLLATYNGEKYVRQQLDSLLAQTYKNLDIYVLDDCSKDSTPLILEEYREKGIHIVSNDEKLGYPGGFCKLEKLCGGAEYYSFCDQDDVWFPEKIERAVKALKRVDSSKPGLYFAAYDIYDGELETKIGQSGKVPQPLSFHTTLFQCHAYGFTVVFNESLRQNFVEKYDQLKEPQKDYWNEMLAAAYSNTIYDPISCAKWRRHESTCTPNPVNFFKFQWWRIKHFLLSDKFANYRIILMDFYKLHAEALSPENKKILQLFQSKGKRFTKTFFPKRLRSTWFDEIMLRMTFLLGKL